MSTRRKYTDAEDQCIRDHYASLTAAQIAERLGRKTHSIYQRALRLGLTQGNRQDREVLDAFIRQKNAAGWLDSEIAAAWPGLAVDRRTVCDFRIGMQLPHNRDNDRHRDQVRQRTQQQLAVAGLNSLAELRVQAFRDFAIREGWPADLRPRAVQILNALYDHGPQTRRQLCDRVGMPWKGSRKSLVSNDPEGSYLAHLQKRELVVCLGRVVTGKGRGKSVSTYAIAAGVKRCRKKATA